MAETRRCRRKRHAGSVKTLAGLNNTRHIRPVCSRITAKGNRQITRTGNVENVELKPVPNCSNKRAVFEVEKVVKASQFKQITMVEYSPEKAGVGGSTPSRGTLFSTTYTCLKSNSVPFCSKTNQKLAEVCLNSDLSREAK